MSLNSRSSYSSPPWGALFFAVLGLAWCGYVAFPTAGSEPCLTSGCALTKDFTVAGISLWWVGGGYFFLLSILCLRGMRLLAWRLSLLALFLDSLFLILMFITGPCHDCLVVAFFFAATCYLLRPTPDGWFQGDKAPPRLVLLPLWVGLFLGNCVLAANEAVPPVTMNTPGNPAVRLYFAPSCPACRDAVAAFGGQATLLPVLEKAEDFEAVIRMQAFLASGMTPEQALSRARQGGEVPDVSLHTKALLMVGLVRNKAAVFKHGFTNMPLIEINGMPKAWTASSSVPGASGIFSEPSASRGSPGDNPPSVDGFGATPRSSREATPQTEALPDFLNVDQLSQCGPDSEPCPE